MITRFLRRIPSPWGNGGNAKYTSLFPFQRDLSSSSPHNDGEDVKIDKSLTTGILTITMNRPQKLNAITDQMYRSMARELMESNRDDGVKLIVITGAGERSFTSGYDLKALVQDYNSRTPAPANGATAFISSLIECRKPLIGLVNGNAVGIGVTLLAHCETVYSTDKASFNTPFIKLGIPPECCSSYLFPKIVGHAKAGSLLHFNDTWSAKDAMDYGLLTRVFPPEKLQTEAWKLINEMAKHPLQSLLASKALLRDRERPILRAVFAEENSKFDIETVGQSAMRLMSAPRK